MQTKDDYEITRLKSKEIKIAVDAITERLKYTFDFVFKERNYSYVLITDTLLMREADLNYSNEELTGIPKIEVSGLLHTETIITDDVQFDAGTQLFKIKGKKDHFAAIFFVLSRMEEYTSQIKDKHGRFSNEQSLLFKHGLLERPICDVWSHEIIEKVLQREVPTPVIAFEPTFDIDNTYAYKYKTGLRRFLSIVRDRLKNDSKRIEERRKVNKGADDPYDTFNLILDIAKRFERTQVFWLVASKQKYDRNLDIEHPEHKSLIKRMSKTVSVHIHPSYASFGKTEEIKNEMRALERITGTAIVRSRQHFLRFNLPKTYRELIEAGIQHDYSMGFAGHCGFRVGTARSIDWFDLERNERTALKIHPFVYMDGTLNEYMELSPDASKEAILALHSNVLLYGGAFRFIWHNETIGDYGKWKGWNEVLNYTLELHGK